MPWQQRGFVCFGRLCEVLECLHTACMCVGRAPLSLINSVVRRKALEVSPLQVSCEAAFEASTVCMPYRLSYVYTHWDIHVGYIHWDISYVYISMCKPTPSPHTHTHAHFVRKRTVVWVRASLPLGQTSLPSWLSVKRWVKDKIHCSTCNMMLCSPFLSHKF